ncbi:MAG TPA: hypothetical protein VE955_00655 [Candidatus Dormibacteraeota bacterium]|nr:hypothetical protein [Candidatus Dormibacteraeota bacterium]
MFNNILASKDRKLIASELVPKYRTLRNLQLLVAAVFAVSILPQFYSVISIGPIQFPVRYLLWTSTFFFTRIIRTGMNQAAPIV